MEEYASYAVVCVACLVFAMQKARSMLMYQACIDAI